MELSKEQLVTLVSDRNQIVIANAGSGKTTILVEKFLHLIKSIEPNELQRIVAITFTKKAAAEMKERIISRLNEEIEELKDSSKKDEEFFSAYQLLMEYRENLSGAKVQTIHSFCQDIIKEFAVEVGYSPYFSILEDIQIDELLDKFFKETLEEFITGNEVQKRETEQFFAALDKFTLQNIIMMFFRNNNLVQFFENDVKKKSYEEFYDDIIQKIYPEYLQIHSELLEEFIAKKDFLLTENSKNSNLKPYFQKIDEGEFENITEEKDLIQKISQFWIDLNEEKVKVNKKLKSYFENPDSFLQGLELFKASKNIEYFEPYFRLLKYIDDFYLSMYEKYEDYKIENSLLTFDDLLNKTKKLLENEVIAERVRTKFDYLLIDEFQDTDDIQYSIVKSIIPSIEFNKHGDSSDSKLFIVGDPKQSIYGFRNADVRVMKKAEKEIMASNQLMSQIDLIQNNVVFHSKSLGTHNLELTDEENLGKIELKISHRLNVINTCFVNLLFSKLMGENSFDYSVGYNPFIFARKNPYFDASIGNLQIMTNLENDMKFGSVKFLLNIQKKSTTENNDEVTEQIEEINSDSADNSEDTVETQDNEKEAALVAKYISSLISNGTKIYDSKEKCQKELKFSDIGILVRKRNGVDKLLKQLDNSKIPYFLNDSKNFFQTQEIIDIISFMKFLYNSEDDLAFASLLKSNFFGFTDNELIEIRDIANESLWNCFLKYSKSSIKYKVLRCRDILEYYISNHNNYQLHNLLFDILLKTNYYETYSLSPSKNSIQMNINSFLNFIKKIRNRGVNSISDMIIEIDKSYIEKVAGEDAFILNENSVNLLTIHKSKGLEFPVVILYNTNSEAGYSNSTQYNDHFGLIFKFTQLDENGQTKEIILPQYPLVKNFIDLKEEEESKRLLYVATTRAKDLLIISASLKYSKKKGEEIQSLNKPVGLFKLINDNIALNIMDIDRIKENSAITYNNMITTYNANKYTDVKINFELPVISEISACEISFNDNNVEEPYYIMLDSFDINPPIFENSASRLQVFRHNSKNYLERYIFKTPEIFKDNYYNVKEGEFSGNIRGTVMHNIFSKLNSWIKAENIINTDILSSLILNELKSQEITNPENFNIELEREIQFVFSSKFITNHISELISSEKEVELNMPFGNDFIKVIIDVLVRMSDGTFEIWDWKSNVVQDKEKFKELSEYYEFQLKYYAFVVSYLYPEQAKFVCRLFFTRLAASANQDSDWIATFEWSRAELENFSSEIENYFERMHNPQEMYKLILENL